MLSDQGTDTHFNPYYQDNALLIQFIVTEFFHVHQMTATIHAAKSKGFNKNQETVQAIYHTMLLLIGPSYFGGMHALHSNQGFLTKLKNYSEHLSLCPLACKKTYREFQSCVTRAWLASFPILACVHFHLLQGTAATNLKGLVNKFLISIEKIGAKIPHLVNLFFQNENVASFLFRSNTELIHIYGRELVEQLFLVFQKREELLPLFARKFKKRGFELSSLIEK